MAPHARTHPPRCAPSGVASPRVAAVLSVNVLTELEGADPTMPAGLSDPHEDVWAPLLAIADRVGGRWPEAARAAAAELCGRGAKHQPEDSTGVALLSDCREIFERLGVDRISSKALAAEQVAIDEAPWGDWYRRRASDDRGIDARGLARQLKPYGIVSRPVRLPDGSQAKGYRRDLFEPAWRSYCPRPENGGSERPNVPTRMATGMGRWDG